MYIYMHACSRLWRLCPSCVAYAFPMCDIRVSQTWSMGLPCVTYVSLAHRRVSSALRLLPYVSSVSLMRDTCVSHL